MFLAQIRHDLQYVITSYRILATIHIIVKDLAFSLTLNDPPRGANGIHEGVANENHCPLEGQVEEKNYDTNVIEIMSLHT